MKTSIDSNISLPIFHQIKNHILSKIMCQELKPHDQLPSEREYQALLGASRQTVRRALDELVLKGVLYRRPGKGTYVSEKPFDSAFVGVVGSISLLATSPDHSFVTHIFDKRLCPPFARELLRLPAEASVIFIEQVTMVRSEPRFIHRSYIPRSFGNQLVVKPPHDQSILEILVAGCSQLPATSRDHLHPGLPDPIDASLLGVQVGSAVQIQRGVILTGDGLAIEAHELIIRGDRFKQDLEFIIDRHVIDQILARKNKSTSNSGGEL